MKKLKKGKFSSKSEQRRADAQSKVGETLVTFVLDETGSMSVCRDATISGFNEYIETLKRDAKGKVLFTLTKFDSIKVQVVHNAVDIKDVQKLTTETYVPGELTPLYDAIHTAIKNTEDKVNMMAKKPQVLCVVMTDGEENASKECSRARIFEVIKAKEKEGWRFVYLGANQDAWAVGQAIGLAKGNVVNYSVNKTDKAFRMMALNTVAYASYCNISGKDQNTYGDFFKPKDEEEVK